MKLLTVNQLARVAHVTVRTLHHYDAIGLLKPASIGRNGYRYYGRDELLRLQQIRLHRELDIPLAEIGDILDAPDFDQLETLRGQREVLAAKADRYAELVRTIDRTIAGLNGETEMTTDTLYGGIPADKQAEYEAWLLERFGGDMPERIASSKAGYAALSEADKAALNDELQAIETAWVEAMRAGVPAESSALDPLHRRNIAWISAMWSRPCNAAAYGGLADMHEANADFVSRYETLGVGFSDYHARSMRAFAERQPN
ncbi:MerR family transcriptional regulator [Devosia sp.]|uniref:MerR family transcriptional regulator n=1 Tax=Devosia sp. TaxID=1871048 RepID=UPI003A8EAB2A